MSADKLDEIAERLWEYPTLNGIRAALEEARQEDRAAFSEPFRVFCEKHSEHKPVYTEGRPLLDDTCARCKNEEDRAEIERLRPAMRFVELLEPDPADRDVLTDPEFWAADYAHAMKQLAAVESLQSRAEAAEAKLARVEERREEAEGARYILSGKLREAEARVAKLVEALEGVLAFKHGSFAHGWTIQTTGHQMRAYMSALAAAKARE